MTGEATGRPLRADARRNRVRVLEAARSAFAEEGAAVPLDEIARRAGVGAGTVYRHFPTKEALFEAVITQPVQELIDDAHSHAGDDDPGVAFFGFLDRLARVASTKKDLTDALAGAGFDVTAPLASVGADLQEALGELLVRAQQAGAVRDDIGIGDLMALLKGALPAVQGGDPTLRDRVFAVLCDGLRADAAG